MPTPLDGIIETHEGPEPRVLTQDVQAILRSVIRPGVDDGESVTLIADKAHVSTRTVYRVLNPDESKHTISLEIADKLCVAADSHIRFCRLVWPDGSMTDYMSLSHSKG